jgi:hypothetical protein
VLTREANRRHDVRDSTAPYGQRGAPIDLQRLVQAISAAVGIEAMVALIDLAGVTRERAVEVVRWSAQALLRTALAEADELPPN